MENHYADFERPVYIFGVLTLVLAALGIVFNLICITALLSIKGSLRTQLRLLLSLVVSDCLLDIIYMLKATINMMQLFGNTVDTVLLDSTPVLRMTATWVEVLTMLSLAVDLSLRVKNPINYSQLVSRQRGTVLITCIWTLPMLLCFGWIEVYILQENVGAYQLIAIQSDIQNVAILLSLILLFALYSCIVSHVWIMATNGSRALRKTVITNILILVAYVICFTPSSVSDFVLKNEEYNSLKLKVVLSLECLFLVNTLLDPIIYVTRVPELRDRLKSAIQYVLQRLRACMLNGGEDTDSSTVAVTAPGQRQLPDQMAMT